MEKKTNKAKSEIFIFLRKSVESLKKLARLQHILRKLAKIVPSMEI